MRGKKHPFSTMLACFAIIGMIAGGAVAFPAKFHAILAKAQQVLHRDGSAEVADGGHRGASSAAGGRVTHSVDACDAAVAGVLQDPPATDDVHGLQHAIAVVEADCGKNPEGRGLLNALSHLVANAQKHADHQSHAGGNGKGHGGGNAAGHGSSGGNGHGHAYGHGAH